METKNEDFKNKVYSLVGDEYTFLEKYTRIHDKILCRHNKCGHEYKVEPNAFMHGNRCPFCYKKRKIKTNQSFKNEVYELVGDEYTFLEKYNGVMTKILCRHNKCGHEYMVKPNLFLSNKRCPNCFGKTVSNEDFKNKVYSLVGDEYTFLEKYINTQTKILCRHNKCGHEYMVKPFDFTVRNVKCPECVRKEKRSKATKDIEQLLNENKINYISEKRFDDCKNILPLPFDFYLPDYNILIEYDGEQHFRGWSGCKKSLNRIKTNDIIKNIYCRNNNIRLIRISYKENHKKIITGLIKK